MIEIRPRFKIDGFIISRESSWFYANPFPPAPGGFFFAKPMRENKYVTMMDPFQQKYGNVLSSALIFPALVADVLWVARTLVSLGKLLHTVKLSGTIKWAHTYLCNHAGTGWTGSGYTMCANMRGENQLGVDSWCFSDTDSFVSAL